MIFVYILGVCCILYTIYCFVHWKIKGVPRLSLKFPFMSPLYYYDGVSVAKYSNMVASYKEMKKKGYNYAGVITSLRSVIIVTDLELIRDILIKNDKHFYDRGFHYTDMYGPKLGETCDFDGQEWKETMSILSPNNLCRKLTDLFESVLTVSHYLIEAIEDCALEDRDIDVRELFACFTTDIITYHSYKIYCHSYRRSKSKFCKCQFDRLSSLGLKTTRNRLSQSLYNTIRHNMRHREAGFYKHFNFSSVESWKHWTSGQDEPIAFHEAFSRMFLFFHVSFDITSTTLNFAVYELCRHTEVQERLRNEIMEVLTRHNNEVTWENLSDMTYLDKVISETLRLYPPIPNAIKRCEKGGCKIKDTNVNISFFTDVVIPLFSLHRDPDYFPDPEEFDPERFDSGKTNKNPLFYMPYGEGPREMRTSIQACTVQTKIGLVQILRHFRLSISPKTRTPLRLKPQAFLKSDVLYVNAERI